MSYKTIFLDTTFGKRVGNLSSQKSLDGVSTANDLEALLVEQDNQGYELHSVIPMTGNHGHTILHSTVGLVVVLRKKVEA